MSPWLFPLLAGAAAIVAALVLIMYRARSAPAERERRRRARISVLGRLGDGMLTDVQGDLVYYSYSVHGVPYNTSQDISALRALVPADASLIAGAVTLKYLPRNPGNSIVVCESWSGLRIRTKTAHDPVDSGDSEVPTSAQS